MKEEELNATMSVIADPINNVYKLDSRQAVEEMDLSISITEEAQEDHVPKNYDKMELFKNIRELLKDSKVKLAR